MNVEGADVERRLGRTIMPRFHAGFSVGTVLGALVGAGCAKAGVSLEWQLAVTVVAILLVGLGGVRAFLPPVVAESAAANRSAVLAAWREPRTLLIGAARAGVRALRGHRQRLAGALAGGRLPRGAGRRCRRLRHVRRRDDRWSAGRRVVRGAVGRVGTLRATALLVVAGVLVVVLSPGVPGALAGAVLLGARRLARLPARDERGRRRGRPVGRPGLGGRLDRLQRVPRRPAADGAARRPRDRAARDPRRLRGGGGRVPGRGRRPAPAQAGRRPGRALVRIPPDRPSVGTASCGRRRPRPTSRPRSAVGPGRRCRPRPTRWRRSGVRRRGRRR